MKIDVLNASPRANKRHTFADEINVLGISNTDSSNDAEDERVLDIITVCAEAGMSDLAPRLIRKGATVNDAREAVREHVKGR